MTTSSQPAYHVVIIGGGISGLSAAWYLQQASERNIRYSVLEQTSRWGGKILTEQLSQDEGLFTVEGGPDSFITQKPAALQLARELGLEDRLLGTNDAARQVFVLNRGRPVPLPDGVLLIVPTKFRPFALSPLVSPLGKLRMGCDLFLPRRKDGGDETLADFVRRRLGTEALDKIAEPLLSGIYNAEAERQSLLATFPRFRELEKTHGSLIRAMLDSRRNNRNNHNGHKQPASPNGKTAASMFMSFKAGTGELVRALVERLTGDLRLNTAVNGLERTANGQYSLSLSDGTTLQADAVIIAAPAYVAATLLRNLSSSAASLLDSIRYVSTGTISLALRREDIPYPVKGFGLVIPRSEQRPINALTWSSIKFDHRAPEKYVLLRIFFGGSRSPATMALDDDELRRVVQAELRSLTKIAAPPIFDRIFRWQRANPQYDVGHLDRVSAIETALPDGLHVIGSPYRGVGIPDCVSQAQQAAHRIIDKIPHLC